MASGRKEAKSPLVRLSQFNCVKRVEACLADRLFSLKSAQMFSNANHIQETQF